MGPPGRPYRRTGAAPRHDGNVAPAGGEQRHLVDVLDHEVPRVRRVEPAERARRQEGERVTRPDAMHRHPVERGGWGTPWPSTAEERDLVPASREPAEDLVQVNLGASRL